MTGQLELEELKIEHFPVFTQRSSDIKSYGRIIRKLRETAVTEKKQKTTPSGIYSRYKAHGDGKGKKEINPDQSHRFLEQKITHSNKQENKKCKELGEIETKGNIYLYIYILFFIIMDFRQQTAGGRALHRRADGE